MQGDANADRQVLLAGDVAELLDQRRVAGRGQPDRLGPLREGARVIAPVRELRVKAWRGSEEMRHRDAQAGALGQLLQAVVPLGRQARRGQMRCTLKWFMQPLEDHVRSVPPGRNRPGSSARLPSGFTPDDFVEHQPDLLFERHLRQQVLDPFLDRAARVLVRVQPAVLVQVAEGKAVLREDGGLGARLLRRRVVVHDSLRLHSCRR